MKVLKFLVLFYAVFVLTFTSAQTRAQTANKEVVHLFTIEELDQNGKSLPLAKDSKELLAYLENAMGVRFEVRRVPWKRAIEYALNDEEALLMGMSKTQERLTKFAFSDPISANGNWLVTRCENSFVFNELEDLRGKVIGVVSGTSAGDEFDQQANLIYKVERDISAGANRLQKLLLGRVDALVWYGVTTDVKAMDEIINRRLENLPLEAKTNKPNRLCVLPKPLSIVTNHFSMKLRDEPNKLLARINLALAKGRKGGQIPK
ncbi:MAG: transporter substrate-binding domain-containing protein [Undibacterium sp.]|nr:transporter substrate-binding domain-containing protein [Undibacterium sp.]